MGRFSFRILLVGRSPRDLLYTVTVLLHACSLVLGQANQAAAHLSNNSLRQAVQRLLASDRLLEAEQRLQEEMSAQGETADTLFIRWQVKVRLPEVQLDDPPSRLLNLGNVPSDRECVLGTDPLKIC